MPDAFSRAPIAPADRPASIRRAWLLAVRPRTLPAAVSPVAVGAALAIADHDFRLGPALGALLGALLLQAGVNVANDYFDFVRGIDRAGRLGPVRVTQSGLISPGRVRAGMALIFALAAADGLYLTLASGWPILAVGLLAGLAALAYSGGPYPLASHGLGDLFVFLFFGLAAVCGTYYAQTLKLTWTALFLACPVGLMITAILVVNNLRDIETDRKAGKITLAVRLGPGGSRLEYMLLLAGAFLLTATYALAGGRLWALLSLGALPLAWAEVKRVGRDKGPLLNQALAGTARLALVFSLLLSAGLVLS
jgi:1,4-dihydroxy-2-naphthoate octaprenyltransferase